jgi:hypothetical protein
MRGKKANLSTRTGVDVAKSDDTTLFGAGGPIEKGYRRLVGTFGCEVGSLGPGGHRPV